jgi:hypothetical protein
MATQLTSPWPVSMLPGQRRIRIRPGPHAQAGEITGHDPERETDSDDHHDPLSQVQPVNPARY